MSSSWKRVAIRTTRLFDSVCALGVMLIAFTAVNTGRFPAGFDEFFAQRLTVRNGMFALLFIVIWHRCFALFGLYRIVSHDSIVARSVSIAAACSLATLVVSFFTLASASGSFGFRVVIYFWLGALVAEVVGRALIEHGARALSRRTRVTPRAVIVGSGSQALRVFHAIQRARTFELLGFVDSTGGRVVPVEIETRLIGSLDRLEKLLVTRAVDRVLIALPVKSCYDAIQRVIEICERVGVDAQYCPDLFALSLARRAFAEDGDPLAVRLRLVVDDDRLVVKRFIDVIGAVAGLVVLAPLLLLCVLAVKVTSPGPIIFSQLRYGYNRRLFWMYKFRTMVEDAEQLQHTLESLNEASGPAFKIRADPRITPVGRWMRKLSLDELPQLVNVVKGDMSLVGPRPMSMRDVTRFSESWLMRRFSVRPGLTCLWQVNGRSNADFDRWVALDLAYIDNWSLALDIRILLKTVPVVLSGSGAM